MTPRDRYCPCNGECHLGFHPCSFDCFVHHTQMHTIDMGFVHTLSKPDGPCRRDCPHPDHRDETP